MPSSVQESYQYTVASNANMTAANGPGVVGAIFVSSASNTPLLTVQDSTTALAANGNAIVQTFVPVAVTYYPIHARFQKGLTVVVSGNVAYTAYWNT